MKRRTVKLPDDLDARVREAAVRRGMSLSLWLREAVASQVRTVDLRTRQADDGVLSRTAADHGEAHDT
jgi:predicted transcriptional regulator